MKRQNWKRIVSIMLSLCMVMSMFAGCGKDEEEEEGIVLSQDVQTISSEADGLQITLTLDGSNWKEELTKDNIKLSGAFEEMTVASVHAKDEKLNLSLTGTPSVDKNVGIYTPGLIAVNKDYVSGAEEDVVAAVSVDSLNIYPDYEKMEISDGKIKLPIVLY